MYGREAEQVNTITLQVKLKLATLKKHVNENGPTTYSQLILIDILDSLTEAIRMGLMREKTS